MEQKAIINGRMYNTETAEYIGEYSNGLGGSDFKNLSEELYRKKNGEFFIAGEGGPLTKYQVEAYGGGWTGSERITPLTEAEARDWVEQYCSVDTYIEIFGEPEE